MTRALAVVCLIGSVAHAQVPDAGVPDAAPPDASPDASIDASPIDAPAPAPDAPPVPPPADTPTGVPLAPPTAEYTTTSAAWRPGYHFDLHWQLLMLPERVIELVFIPFSLAVSAVEEYRLDNRLADWLSFENGRIKLSPRFKFSLGDGAGAGRWIKRSKMFDQRAELRLGGILRLDADWIVEGEYRHAYLFQGGRALRARAYIEEDKNRRYFGIGGDSELADRRVIESFEQGASAEIDLQGIDRYTYAGTARFGLRRQTLGPGYSSTYEPVGEPGDTVEPPPGFDEASLYAEARITGRYDTRDTFGRPTRGLLIELSSLVRQEITGRDFGAATLGATTRWHLPVLPERRVLVFTAAGVAAVPLHPGGTIPFESYAVIGRANVRGYDRERFRDRYSLLASLEYRFPIYEYLTSKAGLDAFLFVDAATLWGKAAWDPIPPLWSTGGGIRGAHETTLVFETTVGYSPEGFQFTIGVERAQ